MTRVECFAGSTALITGASSGLGEEFARQLAVRGCHLVLVARSEDKLRAIAQELEEEHAVKVTVMAQDLAELAGIEGLCRRIEEAGLHVDHLINNAGIGGVGVLANIDPLRVQRLLVLNILAPTILARRFLPHMLAAKRGGLLNVASAIAFYPVPYMANYAASKSFILSQTQALAEEIRGTGLRATVLCPGPVDTDFQRAAGYKLGRLERLALLPKERVVCSALAAYERRRLICMPGLITKMQAWLPRLVPLSLTGRILGIAMRVLGRG